MKVTLLRQSAVVWVFLYYPGKRANDKIKHVQCISLSILYINRLFKIQNIIRHTFIEKQCQMYRKSTSTYQYIHL